MKLHSIVERIMMLVGKSDCQKNKKTEYHDEKKRDYLRDEGGEPIIWYKGMPKSRLDEGGISCIEFGAYFCDNEFAADTYSSEGFVLRAYISVSDPFIIDAKKSRWNEIPWDCNTSDKRDYKRFKQYRDKYLKQKGGKPEKEFSTDLLVRFIMAETSHDAVIICNVYEGGQASKWLITDIVVWDNTCLEIL